jgi:hypothetical protein
MEIKATDIIILLLRCSLFLFGIVFSALAGLYKTMLRHSYHIGELRGYKKQSRDEQGAA